MAAPPALATENGTSLPRPANIEQVTVVNDATDEKLVRRLAAGCEESFAALYRRHQRRVYRFAFDMTGSREVAEEATQEVFLALLGGAPGYDPSRGSFLPFLMGMARNQVLRLLRRERPYVTLAAEDVEPPAAGSVLWDLTRRESLDAVRRAVLSLPENYREVVVLVELEELDYSQAAQALGCAIGTVRSRLHRARALLLDKLRTSEKRGLTCSA